MRGLECSTSESPLIVSTTLEFSCALLLLFPDEPLSPLIRYKENRIGLRWRTEKEVISGKGQFECGNKKCTAREGLRSFEVNFAYSEAGESKQALVKLRVCPKCSYKLNYRKEKELERELRKESRRKKRKQLLKEKKREKRGSRGRSNNNNSSKETRREEDEEEGTCSSSLSSEEDVEEESRFKRTKRKEAPGVHGKGGENKDGEFEPYFKDMFL